MKILVLNSGSSSVKYKLFEMPEGDLLASGMIDKIGAKDSKIIHEPKGRPKHELLTSIPNHEAGLKLVIGLLADKEQGVVKDTKEITAVGHRVVHGGEAFTGSVIINDEVIKTIEEYYDLAPLHNPPNMAGIKAAKDLMPHAKQLAAFDTSFHTTIPKHAFLYALPYEIYDKYKVRKYGFHGTSHRYVARKAAELLKKDKYAVNLITCHLGNGSSITAVKNGKSVDTSMGLTPLEGVAMGTRCGDIDPAIIFYLAGKEGMDLEKINSILNKKSGVLGISGISNDMRNIHEAIAKGNERAKLAFEVFSYRIKKYIGSYMAVLNGTDAIVFTGGVGEKDEFVREYVCSNMEALGIKFDAKRNLDKANKQREITAADSKVKVLIIPTDEEVRIAADTYENVK